MFSGTMIKTTGILANPPTVELSKTNSRYSICKRQTTNERGGGERHETIFNIGDKHQS